MSHTDRRLQNHTDEGPPPHPHILMQQKAEIHLDSPRKSQLMSLLQILQGFLSVYINTYLKKVGCRIVPRVQTVRAAG